MKLREMSKRVLDTFICVHRRDVDYLFEISLQAYLLNFVPKGNLMLISNDLPYLQEFVERLNLGDKVLLSSDRHWLSKRELSLRGWYRQQIIKLRSYQFCETENFCSIGADTILLRPIFHDDLVKRDYPILFHTLHELVDEDFLYEQARCANVARLLQIDWDFSLPHVDFISDLFCFNREDLISLNSYLEKLYGRNSYYELLRGLGHDVSNQKKFGEWTLYSVYLLECLKKKVTLKNMAEGFLRQVHDLQDLVHYQFDSKVVHFVSKNFDVNVIKREIVKRGLELGKRLVPTSGGQRGGQPLEH